MPRPSRIARHLVAIALAIAGFGVSAQTTAPRSTGAALFQITPLDTGRFDLDLAIDELRREPRVSVLRVRGFHARTEVGTRWLMCMFNTLAILRGFEYWTAVYPEGTDETVLIGFPNGPRDLMAETDPRFASPRAIGVVAPIERGVRLCKRVGS